jgi:hypothetical protein
MSSVAFDRFVSAGADPYARSSKNGRTVLLHAVGRPFSTEIVQHLMREYIQRNDPDMLLDWSGNGPLHVAARTATTLLVEQFSASISSNLKNNQLCNALMPDHLGWDDVNRIRALLQAGVDPFAQNSSGLCIMQKCLKQIKITLPFMLVPLVKSQDDLERVWIAKPLWRGVSSDNITFAMRVCHFSGATGQESYEKWESTANHILMMCTEEQLNTVDCFGRTLLHHCINSNHGVIPQLLNFLLQKFERRSELKISARSEPLFFAAVRVTKKRTLVFDSLFGCRKFDINATYRGESLLHYAIRRLAFNIDYDDDVYAFDCVDWLLDHVDVTNSIDVSNLAPIHLLCELSGAGSITMDSLFESDEEQRFAARLIQKSKSVLGIDFPGNILEVLTSSPNPTKLQKFLLAQLRKFGSRDLRSRIRIQSAVSQPMLQ